MFGVTTGHLASFIGQKVIQLYVIHLADATRCPSVSALVVFLINMFCPTIDGKYKYKSRQAFWLPSYFKDIIKSVTVSKL